ncbi:SICAvar, type I [Plasmodium knowlesi strain H]|nr:SICAvar, type I [Plasmodium knowlesi strain H]
MKVLCTAIGEIRYFISGVRKVRKYYGATEDRDPDVTTLTPAEAYARCIVSAVALAEIYGDHCNMKEAIDEVEGAFEQKIRGHLEGKDGKPGRSNQLDVCEGINATDLMVGKAVLGNAIKQWTKEKRNLRYSGGWRVGRQWAERWPHVCRRGKGEEEAKNKAKEENKNILTPFLKVGTDNSIATSGQNNMSTLGDILMNDDMKLPENTLENVLQVVIKDGKVNALKIDEVVQNLQNAAQEEIMEVQKLNKPCNGKDSFCSRVDCVLRKKKEMNGSSTGEPATDDKVRGEIKTEVTNLNKTLSDNGGSNNDIDQYCTAIKCTNDNADDCVSKATCKLIVKALKDIHKIKKDETGSEPGRENDRIFKSTMRCVALNALIHKLKKEAEEGGYVCAVEDGIEKAFDAEKQESNRNKWCGKNNSGNGNEVGSCEECGKDNQCVSTDVGGMKPWTEVWSTLNNDSTTNNNIQSTLNKIHNQATLCDRLQCAINHWKKTKTAGQASGKINDKEMWNDVQKEVTSFDNTLSNSGTDAHETENLCAAVTCPNVGEENCVGKETCKLIVKALKGIHQMKKEGAGLEGDRENDRIFRSTMRCVILNVLAQKLREQADKGGYGCAVEKGIKGAFDEDKLKIKRKEWCGKDNNGNGNEVGSCEECKDQKCIISKIEGEEVWKGVWGMLNTDSNIKVKSTLEGLHSKATLCDRLHCAINEWKTTKTGTGTTGQSSSEDFWTGKDSPMKNLWDELAKKMKDNGGNGTTGNGCDSFETEAEKWACKYLHAGFKELYEGTSSAGTANDGVLSNPSFRQTMGCFLLHAYAKYMKDKATCNIDKGISKAFDSWQNPGSKTGTSCNGANSKGPCVPCQWNGKDHESCTINTNGQATGLNDKVEDKLKTIINKNDPSISTMLTEINKRDNLCDHMKCIATHLNSTNGKPSNPTTQNFWTEGGDVELLWKDLSNAMTNNGNGGTECDNMEDNGGRKPTIPEKKACQYLTAGFNKLKELTSTGATKINGNNILDKDPSFVKTMGCFLLHAYAKKMKGEAKCEIEAGIKKAFQLGNGLIKGVNCNDSSGKGPCVPCEWNEKILDSCEIKTNGGSGKTENTAVKDKLKQVQNKINETSTTTLTNINITESLCEKLQCAAGKWFKNNSTTSNGITTPTKNWCDFWEEEGVRPTLQSMFNKIQSEGKDNATNGTNDVCKHFGDENPQSVERKACNHITAGLQYIRSITGSGTGNTNPLLDRAVGCIALNMYADRIIQLTEKNCPIHEERIKEMFTQWNNNNSCSGSGANNNGCFECKREGTYNSCQLSVPDALLATSQNVTCKTNATEVKTKMEGLLFKNEDQSKSISEVKDTLTTITNMNNSFCTQLQCAAKQYYVKVKNKNGPGANSSDVTWDDINSVVEDELKELLQNITDDKKWDNFSKDCNDDIGSSWSKDTEGEKTAKQKACKLFASGLKHISDIKKDNGQDPDVPLRKTMMCAALNLYADQLISKATNQCPLDNKKLEEAIKYAFEEGNATMNGKSKCTTGSGNSCFECKRQDSSTFGSCQIGKDKNDKVKPQLESLLEKNDETNPNNKEKTLNKINEIESFCTQVQCAIKQHYAKKNNKKTDPNGTVTWSDINEDAKGVLMTLLEQMTKEQTKGDLAKYCNDDNKWSKFGHKGKHTNKAACLLFAAGLKNIYVRGKGQVKGPSFGQTMGCLFLKEYAKQLKDLANKKKRGNSWVHPLCDIDEGIKHAFKQSKDIMRSVLSQCNNGTDGTSCFECTIDKDYNKCSIGTDEVKSKVESIYQDESKQNQMQQTLENTVCPILLTDLLTPFLPLAPVSIGLSAMAYYLWKYFGPLGKGGARFRRSPAEIRGPSVQEQVLDHVEEAGPHEYRLVKERKPRSAPTRTKRSGPVNRRTIIEIHFEVLDECQKGDTQLNQKDFLELLIQEFMGSELMESEQVPKEEVLMESIPMELLPIEEVPSLGSGFMV